MKELGRLLNRKTILLILAAACICVVAVFAGDFSDCGIDNYKIKAREYNWLINGHTDEQISASFLPLTNWHRMIEEYLRDLQRNTRKSLIILMDIQKVSKQLLQMPRI